GCRRAGRGRPPRLVGLACCPVRPEHAPRPPPLQPTLLPRPSSSAAHPPSSEFRWAVGALGANNAGAGGLSREPPITSASRPVPAAHAPPLPGVSRRPADGKQDKTSLLRVLAADAGPPVQPGGPPPDQARGGGAPRSPASKHADRVSLHFSSEG